MLPRRGFDQVPDNDNVSHVIKCDYNGRYFFGLSDFAGALTVARIHAYRFGRAEDARIACDAIMKLSPAVKWRVMKLTRAALSSGAAKEKP